MTGIAKRRELEPGRPPYTKQPWESWPAFEAFVLYREMGSTRTLARVAEAIAETDSRPRKPSTVESQLRSWSAQNRWTERVDAFVVVEDQARLELRAELHERIQREDMEVASKLMAVADTTLGLLEETGMPVDPAVLPRYVEAASRIRRLSAGLSTDNVRGALTITQQDLGRVVSAIVTGACERGFVPEERQEEFIRWVMNEAA